MNNEEKDLICDLWLKVFGTQEGVGRNCPNGAYQFASLVLEEAAKVCEDHFSSDGAWCAEQIRKLK